MTLAFAFSVVVLAYAEVTFQIWRSGHQQAAQYFAWAPLLLIAVAGTVSIALSL